jgi:hypothetical protein
MLHTNIQSEVRSLGAGDSNAAAQRTSCIGRHPPACRRTHDRACIRNDIALNRSLLHQARRTGPEAWKSLSETEAALLDFLRKGGKTSELSAERTVQRTLALLAKDRHLERLLKVADSEPPRLRALLAALAEEVGRDPAARTRLRASLNPLSRSNSGRLHP